MELDVVGDLEFFQEPEDALGLRVLWGENIELVVSEKA